MLRSRKTLAACSAGESAFGLESIFAGWLLGEFIMSRYKIIQKSLFGLL